MKALSSSSRSSAAVQIGTSGCASCTAATPSGRADEADEPQPLRARLLEPAQRVDGAAAGREHRIGDDHVRLGEPGGRRW